MCITKLFTLLAFVATLLLGLVGCDTHDGSPAGTYLGPTLKLGNGTARTWVALDDDGNPLSVGLTLTEAALTGLPAQQHHEDGFSLKFPAQAAVTPFKHLLLNWNPQGHEPPEIYGLPHFDVHFYMISDAARNAITPDDPAFNDKAAKRPTDAYIPAGYVQTPGAVPRMGAHWIDPTSPEFNGQVFTRTFIHGFYDAKLIFFEPMITKAFLESKPNFSENLKLPAAYEKPGFYPTRYSVKHDAANKEYRIALEGFTRR